MSEKIIWQAKVEEVVYIYRVYFDPNTYSVMRVSSAYEADTDYPCIEVAYKDIEDIASGDQPIANCKVFFNPSTKQYKLIKNANELPTYTVLQSIYKCKKIKNADIQLVQDVKKSCWKITISKELKDTLASQRASINEQLTFSVTEENNPNVLYRLFSLQFDKLLTDDCVTIEFKDQFEFDSVPVSVYTEQKFDTYSYEVINEQ
jgi:hypothetical protein